MFLLRNTQSGQGVHNSLFKVYVYTLLFFFALFTKGNNFCDFLFASLENKILPKRGLLFNVTPI